MLGKVRFRSIGSRRSTDSRGSVAPRDTQNCTSNESPSAERITASSLDRTAPRPRSSLTGSINRISVAFAEVRRTPIFRGDGTHRKGSILKASTPPVAEDEPSLTATSRRSPINIVRKPASRSPPALCAATSAHGSFRLSRLSKQPSGRLSLYSNSQGSSPELGRRCSRYSMAAPLERTREEVLGDELVRCHA